MAFQPIDLAQSPPPKASGSTVARPTSSRNLRCWSNLPTDLMRLVFERLGFLDFEQAKSVCWNWFFASRQIQPKNQIPWMIMFPKDNNYCLLYNPEDKQKLYKTQHLGNDFAKSFCIGTYESWLLMQLRDKGIGDNNYNLYILNLLTQERIDLPILVSNGWIISSILWVDEKTKDFMIIGIFEDEDAVFLKKGDISWKQTPYLPGLCGSSHIVYKDNKLYCLRSTKLRIFDFSTETPQRIFKISVSGYVKLYAGSGGFLLPFMSQLPSTIPWEIRRTHLKNNVVVTISGNVLIVTSRRPSESSIWEFEIYKINSLKGNQLEEVVSIGDEAIILDLGITVSTKDIGGIKRNSMYFNGCDYEDRYKENYIFVYDIDKKMVEQLPSFVSSSVTCANARWFVPSFKRE